MLFALAHEAAAWFIILRDAHETLALESFSFPVPSYAYRRAERRGCMFRFETFDIHSTIVLAPVQLELTLEHVTYININI